MMKFLRSLISWTAKNHGVVPDGKSLKNPVRKAEQLPVLEVPSVPHIATETLPVLEVPSVPHIATVKNCKTEREAMIRQLRLHEGERLFPYKCTAGRLTIGVGRNLDDRGITSEESAYLLGNDIDEYWERLELELPWILDLDAVRRRVLLDMAFNLGIGGLLGFKRTLAAIKGGEYVRAAGMMLDSRWARQVGGRSKRLSQMMASGQIPEELRE